MKFFSFSDKKSAGETQVLAKQPNLNLLDHTLGQCGNNIYASPVTNDFGVPGVDVGKTISNDVWAHRSGVESFRCDVQYGEDGKRLEMSHLGANSTRGTSEGKGGTRSFL